MKEHDEWMKAITDTLETAPSIPVPDDFSARLLARLPQQKAPRRVLLPHLPVRPQYGRLATIAAMVLLLMAMLLVNFFAAPSNTWMLLQITLLVQFCGLLLWLTLAQRRAS